MPRKPKNSERAKLIALGQAVSATKEVMRKEIEQALPSLDFHELRCIVIWIEVQKLGKDALKKRGKWRL